MSLRSSLIKDTLFYGLGDLLTKAIAFVLIPLYTNLIEPEPYGVYQLVVLFSTMAQVLIMSGMNMALFKHFVITTDEFRRKQIFSATLVWVLLSSIVIVSASAILSGELSSILTGSNENANYVLLGALIACLESIILILLLIYRMEKKPIGYIFFNSIKVLVTIGINLILVWRYRMGIEGILLSSIVADIAILLPLLLNVGKYIVFPFPRELFKGLILWGLPIVPSSIATIALTMSDRLIIRIMAGLDQAGIYAIGYKIAGAIFLVLTAFRFAWGPYMFELARDRETASRVYPRVLVPLIAGIGFCVVALNLSTPEIFKMFVGEAYHSARIAVIPISSAVIFDAMGIFFGASIQIEDRTIYMPVVTCFSAIINVTLNIILLPKLGFMGAAWAVLISYFCQMAMFYRIGASLMPIRYPFGKIAILLFIIAIGLAGAWFIEPILSRIGILVLVGMSLLSLSGFKSSDISPSKIFKE